MAMLDEMRQAQEAAVCFKSLQYYCFLKLHLWSGWQKYKVIIEKSLLLQLFYTYGHD